MTTEVMGDPGMFPHLQHALTYSVGRHTPIYNSFHDEIQTGKTLLAGLAPITNHLHNILPHLTTWSGAADVYHTGMGGLCRDPAGN